MKPASRTAVITFSILCTLACKSVPEKSKINVTDRTSVEMLTDYGIIELALYNETPKHRANFIRLVNTGAYDSLLFHRVIKTFMIQAGDPNSKTAKSGEQLGNGDASYEVDAEFRANLFHKRGALAAARDSNPRKASSAMQFYIVQGKTFNDSTLNKAEERINISLVQDFFKEDSSKTQLFKAFQNSISEGDRNNYRRYEDSILKLAKSTQDYNYYSIPEQQRDTYKRIGGAPHLDQNYTVFGEVIIGLSVLDSIANAKTDSRNRPIKDIRIKTIKIIE
jgi:peptidyl-prolyl cis-trans isomerase B (cyclophilin B)